MHRIALLCASAVAAQAPLVPGYVADPSPRKVGGTYYLCVTTDGYRPATSRSIYRPYHDAPSNPLVQTDPANGVFGPGHGSIVDGRTFALYHRQEPERAPACNDRFSTLSEVRYAPDGHLEVVGYVHDWGAALGRTSRHHNLARGRDVFATTETPAHGARNATDGRNDTRWTTGANEPGILTVDLGARDLPDIRKPSRSSATAA